MKSPPTFEIKVAVIGPVSAGKSTLLNALLVGKYSEVSTQRTTAGVNFFRLNHALAVPPPKESSHGILVVFPLFLAHAVHPVLCILCCFLCWAFFPALRPEFLAKARSAASFLQASQDDTKGGMVPDQLHSEDEVLQTITKDNQALRDNDCSKVSEKTFDIALDKPLFKCRYDTKFVIVDVPGINEADSNSKYREYIANNWRTYDCVILVMDSQQVANTEEQVDVLEFVKNTMESRKIPVVILFNKIDEIDSLQVESAIQEAQEKVASVFGVPNDLDLVQDIVAGDLSFENWDKSMPIFLPISAKNGYVYRLAQAVDKERFKMLERELVEALGQEEIGRAAWRRVREDKKYDAAYEAISQREVYEEGIKTSNFPKFLSVLEFCVGGDKAQALLIEQQLRMRMETFAFQEDLALEVSRLYDSIQVFQHLVSFGGDIWKELQDTFWKQYRIIAKKHCRVTWESPLSSHVPIEELIKYHEFAGKVGWDKQQSLAIEEAILYLNRLVQTVLESRSDATSVLGLTYDAVKLSQIFEVVGMARCSQNPFQEAKLMIEVARQKIIATLAKPTLKECDCCGKLVPGGVLCHYENNVGYCLPIHNFTCPNPDCAPSYPACLKLNSDGILGCPNCDGCWKNYSISELVVKYDFEDGGWKATFPNGEAVFLNRPNQGASNPSHFGHGFWLFFEWMNSMTIVGNVS